MLSATSPLLLKDEIHSTIMEYQRGILPLLFPSPFPFPLFSPPFYLSLFIFPLFCCPFSLVPAAVPSPAAHQVHF